jgi:hypothetical protein
VYKLGNKILTLNSKLCFSQLSLYDYMKPVYIQNSERNNMNPTSDTAWTITAHDTVNKIITFNNALPTDIADFSTNWKKRWTVHTLIDNYVQISNVDFVNKQITYSFLRGTLSIGQRARFLNAMRSFSLDPATPIIGVNAWATTYVSTGGVWLHSDGLYRMIVNGWDSSRGMTGLYKSSDLTTWTDVTGNYYYRAGDSPFNKAWCVGTATHNTMGSPLKIPSTSNYCKLFQGLNAAGNSEMGVVIFDENFGIVTMPTSGIVIPGYSLTGHHYIPGGCVYYQGKYLIACVYRDIAATTFTVLLLEIDSPTTYNVTNVEVVVSALIPNSYCQQTLLMPCPIVFNNNLYIFIGGENNSLTDSPLINNEEGGVWYKQNGVWVANKENPMFINPIQMYDIYASTLWAYDHIGASFSFITVGTDLNCFVSITAGSSAYQIGRTVMSLT